MSLAPRAETIITGRIATLAGESGFGWQPGIAIGNGRVIAVGGEPELAPLATSSTEWWRLGPNLAVMPGITDAHIHLMMLVLAETQLDLTDLDLDASLAAIAAAHEGRLRAGDSNGWLLGHGWSVAALGGWPDAAQLERAAPGRPVALYAHDHHSRWISPAAIALAGIDGPRGDERGDMVRRDAAGRPSGVLHEGACSLVDSVIPETARDELIAGLDRVARLLAGLGLTGCHDPGELDDDREIRRGPLFYQRVDEQRGLPLRVHASIRAPQLERAIELGLRSGDGSGRYRMGWLKLFADGSLGTRSAALLEPYSDATVNPPTGGPTGLVVTDREELADLLGTAGNAGIAGEVHAIGDAGVRMVLDVMERLPALDSAAMRRVEHAQLIDPADQSRFGSLGVAASVQPVHLRSDAPQARIAWGERALNAFPLRSLLDGGALIPFGTDAPVEPADPWPGIAVAVARRDPFDSRAEPLGPEQAITLARSIRAACLDPALVAGRDDLGRLLPGCLADLLIVPAGSLDESSDPAVIASTRPLATLIDGRPVHVAEGFSA
jgi:predicted amidohydrolase YtcJ